MSSPPVEPVAPMSEGSSSPQSPRPLPPVEAPSARFLLQLFLIPLLIVTVIVMVWLLFSWLAHMGTDPRDLVRDIAKVNDASWQRAYNLAELMRKPQYAHLKEDRELAKELASTLNSLRASRPLRQQETQAATGSERQAQADAVYENRVKLEIFLCHVLGEFKVEDGLPALVSAAGEHQTKDPQGLVVRSAALQAIAVQAGELEPERMQKNDELMATVIAASMERGEGDEAQQYDTLRSSAAFALGMIGGDEALERLTQMLDDGDANTRYNAATALARHGDTRALPVLKEMLDPNSEAALDDPDAVQPEHIAAGQEWKRVLVLTNGIRAARQMVERNPEADYGELVSWLDALQKSDVNSRVKLNAKELKIEIEAKS